jgi:prepilin-type N-terminal cleavage/methylation domain-containing protein
MKKINFKNSKNIMNKGFTLIELLIVIAVLGVLAATTIAVIDPIDKLRAGNDSKVETDIVTIGKAAEAYAAVDASNLYPTTITAIVTAGQMRSAPVAPGGYTAYTWSGGGAVDFIVYGQLKSKKFTNAGTPFFKYTSATGKACASATNTGAC